MTDISRNRIRSFDKSLDEIVAFCGAGGTGKTTTLNMFVERNPQFKVIRSQSRPTFEKFGVLREDDQDRMAPQQKWELQKAIQEAHWEYMQQFVGQKAIAERTQLDQLTYALQYCYDVITVKEYEWLCKLARDSLPLYGTIFYFPLVEFPGTDDGMRTAKFGKRLQFDWLLQGIIRDFKAKTITVPTGSVQSRVEFVEFYLGIYNDLTQN